MSLNSSLGISQFTMKLLRQLSKQKLSSAVGDLPIFMPRKKKMPMLSVGSTVVAKCREFWESLTGGGFAVARRHADDYFKGSYEFSCTATPINVLAKSTNGRGRRRWRLMPPCICGKQAQEMLESISPAKGWSPESSIGAGGGNEIDGLAEEFIRRFYEQLRMQRVEELQVEQY